MKRPAIIELTWIDAHFHNGASTETPEYEPVERYTVGFDVGVKNGAQGIAQTIDFAGERDALMYQDILWVPKGMVRKRKVLRRALV